MSLAVDRQAEKFGEAISFGYLATGVLRTVAKRAANQAPTEADNRVLDSAVKFLEAAKHAPEAMDALSFDSRGLRSVVAFDAAAVASSRTIHLAAPDARAISDFLGELIDTCR